MISGFVLSTTACSQVKEVEIKQETETKYNDEDILNYFKELKEKINNSEITTKAKEKAIDAFETMVDFIFYDKEIYGITYDDLKDQTKEDIDELFTETDSLIEDKFPNYKDSVSSKYDKVKDYLKEKYNNLKEKINDNLSDENKEKIEQIKEKTGEIKEKVSDEIDSSKVKIKNWYEQLKK